MLETACEWVKCILDSNAQSLQAQIEADQGNWRLLDRSTNYGRSSHHSLHEASLRADTHCPCPPRNFPRFRSVSTHTPSIGNLSNHSCDMHGNDPTMRTGYVRRVVICGLHVRHGVSYELLPCVVESQSAFHTHNCVAEAALGRRCFVLASDGNQALSTRSARYHETRFSAETTGGVDMHRLPLAVHTRWPPLLSHGYRTRGLATIEDVHDAANHQRYSHVP